MNPLDRQWFYTAFKKRLRSCVGKAEADRLWAESGEEYTRILAMHPERRML